MRLSIFVAAVVMFMPMNAFAGSDVTAFKLQNGLQAIVIEDHRAPVVQHMLWYKVGAADELPGKSGVAHLLEHLLFKGTTKMASAGEFSQLVSAIGGSENAFTTQDYTGYWQRVSADRLEQMMKMEADRMQNLGISAQSVVTEHEVVLEERNMRTDSNPGQLLNEQMDAALYLNHPYGTSTIGWRQEVDALTREDALAIYHKYYAPNNAILIVAGDVDPAEVKQLAQKYYGILKPTPGLGERVRPQEPTQLAARRLRFFDPRVGQPYIKRSYLAPERNHGDQRTAAALSLLAAVLGGDPLTSVLGRKLSLEQKVALSVSVYYDGTSYDKTSFNMLVVPTHGTTLRQAEDVLDKGLADFIENGFDEGLLTRIKSQIKASQIYALDVAVDRAQEYGQGLASGLTITDVEAWPDLLQTIQPQEIIDAAKLVLKPNYSVTGWLERSAKESDQ